jgi:ribosomal protein L44E
MQKCKGCKKIMNIPKGYADYCCDCTDDIIKEIDKLRERKDENKK